MTLDLSTIQADVSSVVTTIETVAAPLTTTVNALAAIPFITAIPGIGTAIKDLQMAEAAATFLKTALPKFGTDIQTVIGDLEADYAAVKAALPGAIPAA